MHGTAPPRPPHALAALERDIAALREAWARSMPAWGAVGGAAQVQVERMSDPGLMQVTDALAQVRRDIDAVLARVRQGPLPDSSPCDAASDHDYENVLEPLDYENVVMYSHYEFVVNGACS